MILLFHVGAFSEDSQRRQGMQCPKPCMGPAIGVKRKHPLNEMPHENVLKLDGTVPQRGESVICGTCGHAVHLSWLSYQLPGF